MKRHFVILFMDGKGTVLSLVMLLRLLLVTCLPSPR